MHGHHGKQPMRRPGWSLLALLLVALFLGHDSVMAAEAMAMPRHDGMVTPQGSPAPGHPANCGVSQPALPRSGAHAAAATSDCTALLSVPILRLPADEARAADVWEEPRWPPGTRRALCQVYRL
jgi:hypothetical protein